MKCSWGWSYLKTQLGEGGALLSAQEGCWLRMEEASSPLTIPGTGRLSLSSISLAKPCMEPAQFQEGEERDSIFGWTGV